MRNQRQEILNLLRTKKGFWVNLPEILKLGIAQYNARIFELRREGYIIENKVIEVVNGEKHTAFKLISEAKDTEQEASVRQNNLIQETMINTKQGQGVCC